MLFRFAAHPVAMGIFTAAIIGLAGALLLSLVFYATSLSEAYLHPAANVLYLAGAFAGSFVGARKARRRGVLLGIGIGTCYFAFFLVLVLLAAPGAISVINFFLKALYTLITAAVGGACGIAFAE
jgi:putative membrane protein (TIGR04086 family)